MTKRISTKGQVVVPARLRKKHNLDPGSPVVVEEKDGQIVIVPLPKDPVEASFGILREAEGLAEELLRDRRSEKKREAKRSR